MGGGEKGKLWEVEVFLLNPQSQSKFLTGKKIVMKHWSKMQAQVIPHYEITLYNMTVKCIY